MPLSKDRKALRAPPEAPLTSAPTEPTHLASPGLLCGKWSWNPLDLSPVAVTRAPGSAVDGHASLKMPQWKAISTDPRDVLADCGYHFI